MTTEATTVQRLRQRIASGKVVVVVGAGVSIGATLGEDGRPHPCASWAGLVRAGVEKMRDSGVRQAVISYAEDLLKHNEFEEAADLITDHLKNFYAGWLQECFDDSTFKVTHPEVPRALHALGCPILTTNYDRVLERESGRDTLYWRNAEAWPQAQNYPTRYVLHVHGVFTDSKTVVFGRRTYEELVSDATSQALWRSLATEHSLLFVGVGKSFDDPNFSRLGGYLTEILGQAGQEHYRLVHAGQDDGVDRDSLFEQKILHIEYGNAPADLLEFLLRLAPVPNGSAPGRLPLPAILTVDVDDHKVLATLHSDPASPQSASADCGLNAIALETLSIFDEWIRSDPPGADDREGLRTRVIQQMGRILFDAVFRGDVRKLYDEGLHYQKQLREERTRSGQAKVRAPLEIVLRIKKTIIPLFRSINQIDLDDLPWELLWEANSGHLAASNKVVLVRGTEDQSQRFEGWQPPDRLNVLVALAQPEELVSRVRATWPGGRGYDSVIADIRSAIGTWDTSGSKAGQSGDLVRGKDGSAARGRIHVFELDDPSSERGHGPGEGDGGNGEQRAAQRRCRVTWERFKSAFAPRAQPGARSGRSVDVVHFIGHAGVAGLNRYIAFEASESDPTGRDGAEWVSFDEIDKFIRGLEEQDRPTLVMLHLCQGPAGGVSGPAGPLDLTRASFTQLGYLLMQAQIPLVVAMQYPMWPDAGAVFTTTFYSEVQQATVPQAVQAARNAVSRGVTGASSPVGPVLFMGADVREILVPLPVASPDEASAPRTAGGIGTSRLEVPSGNPLYETAVARILPPDAGTGFDPRQGGSSGGV